MLAGGTWPWHACSDWGRLSGGTDRGAAAVGRASTRTNTKERTETKHEQTLGRYKLWGSGRAVEGAVAGQGTPSVGPWPSLMRTVFAARPVGARGSRPPGVAAGPRAAGGQGGLPMPGSGTRRPGGPPPQAA